MYIDVKAVAHYTIPAQHSPYSVMLPSVWPRGFLATQVYFPKCGSPARLIVSFIST